MDAAEELKLTYTFEWEKIAALGSRDLSSRGKRNRELGLREDQNLSSDIILGIMEDWIGLIDNNPQGVTYIWASWLN
jgi:hypothetical protein